MNKEKKIFSDFICCSDCEGRGKMKSRIMNTKNSPQLTVIGKSILGRDIECYRVGRGKKSVLYVGAYHAKESITANILYALTFLLSEDGYFSSWFENMSLPILLNAVSFYIVPCVNPDGIELRLHGSLDSPLKDRQERMSKGDYTNWQANGRGVDLNHNYAVGFFEYKEIEREKNIIAGPTLYSGEYPESEPESFAVANLLRVINPSAVVSLHASGEEIYAFPKNDKIVKRLADRISKITGYKEATANGTAEYGGFCDYTGYLGIPSFTLEVGKGPTPVNEGELDSLLNIMIPTLVTLPTML